MYIAPEVFITMAWVSNSGEYFSSAKFTDWNQIGSFQAHAILELCDYYVFMIFLLLQLNRFAKDWQRGIQRVHIQIIETTKKPKQNEK